MYSFSLYNIIMYIYSLPEYAESRQKTAIIHIFCGKIRNFFRTDKENDVFFLQSIRNIDKNLAFFACFADLGECFTGFAGVSALIQAMFHAIGPCDICYKRLVIRLRQCGNVITRMA